MTTEDEAAIQQAVNNLISLLEHPGFKLMQHFLDQKKKEAIKDLCYIDPENTPVIRQLQEVVARADYYFAIVQQLINEGLSMEDLATLAETMDDDGAQTQYGDFFGSVG